MHNEVADYMRGTDNPSTFARSLPFPDSIEIRQLINTSCSLNSKPIQRSNASMSLAHHPVAKEILFAPLPTSPLRIRSKGYRLIPPPPQPTPSHCLISPQNFSHPKPLHTCYLALQLSATPATLPGLKDTYPPSHSPFFPPARTTGPPLFLPVSEYYPRAVRSSPLWPLARSSNRWMPTASESELPKMSLPPGCATLSATRLVVGWSN
ncbi:hypothetical protein BJ322DRAFT_825273 [Thelephora terrestris]|uniref:Uncharacterized protein n=1 Tax=Thelephora terrestris TaxID=56493 RepID=A0A9P6HE91_9AGAM|nr:hypothetical protein BJ322DRAFT_825273 [Thelephora terrestris]